MGNCQLSVTAGGSPLEADLEEQTPARCDTDHCSRHVAGDGPSIAGSCYGVWGAVVVAADVVVLPLLIVVCGVCLLCDGVVVVVAVDPELSLFLIGR